ncbi:MAG: hypothetical protein ACR2IE_20175 [Candidatus Sumerlaeaceae bacterium]
MLHKSPAITLYNKEENLRGLAGDLLHAIDLLLRAETRWNREQKRKSEGSGGTGAARKTPSLKEACDDHALQVEEISALLLSKVKNVTVIPIVGHRRVQYIILYPSAETVAGHIEFVGQDLFVPCCDADDAES